MSDGVRVTGALIDAARRGEREALDRLLGGFYNYLRLLARTGIDASLRGQAAPSDVVNETMYRACRRFDQFRGRTEAELAGWLRQILFHHLADLARSRQETRPDGRAVSLHRLLDRSAQGLEKLLEADQSSPSHRAHQRDLAVVLADALAELSAEHREVIVLHDLEELDWDEVSRRMDRTPGAVRMLWARALTRLKPLLQRRL
jgi:RNA polymerase sigma-70 factor (ECF subfamily)